MRTHRGACDTLVLFNTSHKHNKITRPAQRVRHVTRAPRSRVPRLAFPRKVCQLLLCLARPCRRGLCSRRARDYPLLYDALVDGSLPRRRGRRPTTSSHLNAGETRSISRRPASRSTMNLRRIPKYAKRQRRLCTDGRSACAHNVQQSVTEHQRSGRMPKALCLSSLTVLRMRTETSTWVSLCCHGDVSYLQSSAPSRKRTRALCLCGRRLGSWYRANASTAAIARIDGSVAGKAPGLGTHGGTCTDCP